MGTEHEVMPAGLAIGASHSKAEPSATRGKKPVLVNRGKRGQMIPGVLTWRPGPAPSWNRRSTHLSRGHRQHPTVFEQAVAELKQLSNQVPASLNIRPSLNQCKQGAVSQLEIQIRGRPYS